MDGEDFIFETSLQLSGQLLSAPIIVFFGGGLSFLNKSLMLMMLCDASLLNWLTLVLTVSHINIIVLIMLCHAVNYSILVSVTAI